MILLFSKVSAIIGYDELIYDIEKMVECLMDEHGLTYEDAVDFISYNTLRALSLILENPDL